MIDSHTHLDLCADDDAQALAELVARAGAAGVERMLTVGIDGASCRAALAAAESFPQVYAAVGRHPNEARGFDDADLAELRALAAHERCVAIGETGLDFYRDNTPAPDQERAFLAQVELARDLGKPLVIHTRAAEERTVQMLRSEAGGLEVIMHCFSMPARLRECVEAGWWISFAGNVTYPSAKDLAEAAAQVPAEQLLVETDAPYLAPQAVRGKPNEPAYVVHTASFIARLRDLVVPEALDELLAGNGRRLFGW